jgi:hypothetical protein
MNIVLMVLHCGYLNRRGLMLRYNIRTGVRKIKTKTTIVISAVALGTSGLGMAVAIPALSHAIPTDCSATIHTSNKGDFTAREVAVSDDHVSGDINAHGCDIGVYVGAGVTGVTISANIHDANNYGILVDGSADTTTSTVTNTGNHNGSDFAPNGVQTGIGIYYDENSNGAIDNNIVNNYQKGGIVAKGAGVSVSITNNTVTGAGPIKFIAQNGIQVSSGATATSFSGNTVSGNIYTQNGSAAPGGVGSSVGVVSTGVLFFGANSSPKVGTIASSNHVFQNQSNVTIL